MLTFSSNHHLVQKTAVQSHWQDCKFAYFRNLEPTALSEGHVWEAFLCSSRTIAINLPLQLWYSEIKHCTRHWGGIFNAFGEEEFSFCKVPVSSAWGADCSYSGTQVYTSEDWRKKNLCICRCKASELKMDPFPFHLDCCWHLSAHHLACISQGDRFGLCLNFTLVIYLTLTVNTKMEKRGGVGV